MYELGFVRERERDREGEGEAESERDVGGCCYNTFEWRCHLVVHSKRNQPLTLQYNKGLPVDGW